MQLNADSGIREIFACGIWNPAIGFWNSALGIQNPANDWNPESGIQIPLTRNLESRIQGCLGLPYIMGRNLPLDGKLEYKKFNSRAQNRTRGLT